MEVCVCFVCLCLFASCLRLAAFVFRCLCAYLCVCVCVCVCVCFLFEAGERERGSISNFLDNRVGIPRHKGETEVGPGGGKPPHPPPPSSISFEVEGKRGGGSGEMGNYSQDISPTGLNKQL